MSSLQDRALKALRREQLVPPGGRVFAALSGGPDSVALTLLLHEIAPAGGFVLAGVVHLNHRLRAAAAADERFCREFAARLALPIEVEQADVRGMAERAGVSIEAAGHQARYALFERVAGAAAGHARVATAHTRDDQAETYLMRLIRGAGPAGLAGIRPRWGRVVRPLLQVSRSELRAYLAARGQPFREDETNRDTAVTRNRVRHELIPFLEARFSPSIVDALARGAAIARADAAWIDAAVDAAAGTVLTVDAEEATVDAAALGRQPPALARRLARRALEHAGRRRVGFDHVERFLALAGVVGSGGGGVDFPGCRVERRGPLLVVRPARPRGAPRGAAEPFRYELRVPGRVRVPEAGLEISAEQAAAGAASGRLAARGDTVAVAARDLSPPLVVRGWRPGDALRPLGLRGRKKLQDLFVDRKVARGTRHRVPLVADRGRGIVWVVGHTVADDFRITPTTEGMLILKARKLRETG